MARNNQLDTPRETRRSLRPNFDPETVGRTILIWIFGINKF